MSSKVRAFLLLTGIAALAPCAYSCASSPQSKATKYSSPEDEPVAIVEAGCINDAGAWIPVYGLTSAGGVCDYSWMCLPDGSFYLTGPPREEDDHCAPRWCKDFPPIDGGQFRAFPPFSSFPARDGCNTCTCEVYDKDNKIYRGGWPEIDATTTRYFSRIVCTNLACPDASADAAPLDADASDASGD